MKKVFRVILIVFVFCIALQGCSLKDNPISGIISNKTTTPEIKVTSDMAFKGVDNYCHKNYDWSAASKNPNIMYVVNGEETDTTYQVIFHSYTGANVSFFVEKATGQTTIVEAAPDKEEDTVIGTIDIFEYLEK